MTDTQSLSERLRKDARWLGQGENSDLMAEAADVLDAKDELIKRQSAEIGRLVAVTLHCGAQDAEIERLRAVRDVADTLVNECEGGHTTPSLSILARLESALAMENKAKRMSYSDEMEHQHGPDLTRER